LQWRHTAEFHEAEYTLKLLQLLGLSVQYAPRAFCKPTTQDSAWIGEKLSSLGITGEEKKLVVIHPGSDPGTLPWGKQNWSQLLSLLCRDGRFHCMLAGPNRDRELVREIVSLSGVEEALSLVGQTTIGWLTALVHRADLFIGPRTGALHIASTVGCAVVGIYASAPTESPKRWGPWQTEKKQVITPPVLCPAKRSCLNKKCPYYSCMDKIYPETVYKQVKTALSL
jgi:ADP-heptose:LPS heptosyltransferase